MGNTYFNCKKFSIQQDGVAMKVGVDGMLLGAWTPINNAKRGLDVGTGTGLLSLMLAQKNKNLQIDAIDIDEGAVKVASENVAKSEFSSQIVVSQQSFQEFAQNNPETYDIIICNPPYFSEDIKPENDARRIARHDDRLGLSDLIDCAKMVLNENGVLSFIFPSNNILLVENLVQEKGFFMLCKTVVYPSAQKKSKRMMYRVGMKSSSTITSTICIREDGKYTEAYKELTKEYYLNLK